MAPKDRRAVAACRRRARRGLAVLGLLALGSLGGPGGLGGTGPAFAQAPAGVPAPGAASGEAQGRAQDEAALAAAAFEVGVPEPAWADPPWQPPDDPPGATRAAAVRVADTQLHAGPSPTMLIRRVLHARGAADLSAIGHLQTSFQPRFQRMRLHRLQVVRDGRVIDRAGTATVRFLQRERELESGVVGGTVTASILVPDLRIGDTLHLSVSIVGANPVLGPPLAQRVHWDTDFPVGWRRVTLVQPASARVRWQWMGGAAGDDRPAPVARTDADGSRRLRFEAFALPAVRAEPNMPDEQEAARALQFTGWESWNEVARWAATLFPVDVELPPEARALAMRLRAEPDRAAQVVQALQWVQTEIRNWSVALGEGSHRPRTPQEVVQRRYGDCKDKSWLLVRLLRELDIDAQPVLASAAAPRGPAGWLPSADAFDHVIVRVRLDGREYFLEPTRERQVGRLDRLGQPFEGAAVLPADPASHALVTVTTPNRDEVFLQALTERFRIDAFGGDGTIETEMRWTGLAAEFMRMAARELDASRWRGVVLADVTPRYPGASLVGEPALEDDRELNVVRLRASFDAPGLAVDVGGGAWALRHAPVNLRGSLALPAGATRRFPLKVPVYPYRRTYEAEVHWPAGVDVDREPHTERMATPHFEFESLSTASGAVQHRTLSFAARVPAVPPQELARFVDDVRSLVGRLDGEFVVRAEDCGGDCAAAPAPGPR